jgi:hypothetical protein
MVHHVMKMAVYVFMVHVVVHTNNVLIFGEQVTFPIKFLFLQKSYFVFIGARVAHDSCYTNLNPSGSMTGHCGYDSRLFKYIPCFDK